MATGQTHPNANYAIVLSDGTRIEVLPTPRLIDEVSRAMLTGRWIEAYEDQPASERYPAIWRVREDGYDPAGTTYSKVRWIEQIR